MLYQLKHKDCGGEIIVTTDRAAKAIKDFVCKDCGISWKMNMEPEIPSDWKRLKSSEGRKLKPKKEAA